VDDLDKSIRWVHLVKHPRGMQKVEKRFSKLSVHNAMLLKKLEVTNKVKKKKQNKKGRTLITPNVPSQKIVEEFFVHNINNDFYFFCFFV
jgi:hypothetical protein